MTPHKKFDPPSYEDIYNEMIEQYYTFWAESDRIEKKGYVSIQRA